MPSNFGRFQEIQKQVDSESRALYVIWNPEICQDPSTCGQDNLVHLTLSPKILTTFALTFHGSNQMNKAHYHTNYDLFVFDKHHYFFDTTHLKSLGRNP